MISRFAFFILWILGVWTVRSVAEDLSSWKNFSQARLVAETASVAPGHRAQVGLWIQLAPEWHTYWSNPGDSGDSLKLRIKSVPQVLDIEVKMPLPKRTQQANLTSFAYHQEVLFPIEFQVPSGTRVGSEIRFQVEAEWLICQKVCIPANDAFDLKVPVAKLEDVRPSPDFPLFQRVFKSIPAVARDSIQKTSQGESVRLRFPSWSSQFEFVDFLPYRGAGFKNGAPVLIRSKPLEIEVPKSRVSPKRSVGDGVLVMRTPDSKVLNAWSFGDSGWRLLNSQKAPEKNIAWFLLAAFLGGLILNLMPCVFPILSMKLLSLVKIAHASPREVLAQNLAYTLGVVVSFLSVALLLLGLRETGQMVGWGFQLQSPVFVTLLTWLFVLLALQMLGLFDLDFLAFGGGQRLTQLKGVRGSFFTGVLAVVVASPCTAPFMGAAIGYALMAPWWMLLLVFLMLGLGLSFPYLLFSLVPPSVRYLPRPGPWMKRFKEWMALPLILTSVWLLWLVGQLAGLESVFVALTGCLILAFAVWAGRWNKRISAVVSILFLIMCIGWIYQQGTAAPARNADESVWLRYQPGIWEKFNDRLVFIDMTADWCLSCRVNEQVVLNTPEILELFKSHNAVLVRGDWTQRNHEITEFLNKFERAGVPFYVLFSPKFPEGKVLPEVLTRDIVRSAVLEAAGEADASAETDGAPGKAEKVESSPAPTQAPK